MPPLGGARLAARTATCHAHDRASGAMRPYLRATLGDARGTAATPWERSGTRRGGARPSGEERGLAVLVRRCDDVPARAAWGGESRALRDDDDTRIRAAGAGEVGCEGEEDRLWLSALQQHGTVACRFYKPIRFSIGRGLRSLVVHASSEWRVGARGDREGERAVPSRENEGTRGGRRRYRVGREGYRSGEMGVLRRAFPGSAQWWETLTWHSR